MTSMLWPGLLLPASACLFLSSATLLSLLQLKWRAKPRNGTRTPRNLPCHSHMKCVSSAGGAARALFSMDRLGMNKKSSAPGRRVTTLYDDTDYTYADNRKAVQNSRNRVKKSKQFGKDGKRLAPWMVIDEDRIDKARKQRRENKRKTGKFFG